MRTPFGKALGDTGRVMPDSNAELVRSALDRFNETGAPAWDLCAPDLIFTTRGDLEGTASFHGHEGFAQALEHFHKVWGRIRFEVVEIAGNDPLVALLRIGLQGRESGVPVSVDEAWAVWFRDGKMSRIEQHATKPEALKAAGLE